MPVRGEDSDAARRAARRDFTAWWAAHPVQAGLRARLATLDAAGTPDGDALIAAAEPLLDDVAWLGALIAAAAAPMARDPWYEPPLRPLDPHKQRGLVLFDDRRLRISVQSVPLEPIAAHKVAAHGRRSVGFTGAANAMRVLRAGGAVLDLWEADPAPRAFAAHQAGRCRRAGQRVLADGLRFAIDGRRAAWTIARQTGDMVLLQATARHADTDLALEYDAGTGAFRAASAIDGAVARVQLMATLLRLMGRRDAAPALAALACEGPFFQRWHMARELAALDGTAARPLLERLARADPHAEIRSAAARTLDLLVA